MKRVNLLCLLVLGLFFASCHSSDDTWGDWSLASEFSGKPRTAAVTFTSEDGSFVYVGLGKNQTLTTEKDKALRDFYKFNGSSWIRVDSFPAINDAKKGRYGSVAFVIGQYAYVGTGYRDGVDANEEDTYYRDFYIFDMKTDKWVLEGGKPKVITNFPGDPRKFAVAFTLQGKGYVGTGMIDGSQTVKDFYRFTPSADGLSGTWEQIGDVGESVAGAVAMVIQGKAVVCLGAGASSSDYKVGVYVLEAGKDEWTSKHPIKSIDDGEGFDDEYDRIPRAYAVGFTSTKAGNKEKGYIATGIGSSPKTCWEYDVTTDLWDEVTPLPAAMSTRSYCVGFTFRDYGFVTTGGTGLDNPITPATWKFWPGIDEDDKNDWSPSGTID